MINDLKKSANLKHALRNSWSFWYFINDKHKPWKDRLNLITSVDTVEQFWGVYDNMEQLSKSNGECDFMFFKKNIKPMWEHPENSEGGRWVVNLDKNCLKDGLDEYWLNTLLGLVGDQFLNEGPFVNGAWVSIRPKLIKICLWTKSANNQEVQLKIGRRFKEILNLKDKDQVLVFEEHKGVSN